MGRRRLRAMGAALRTPTGASRGGGRQRRRPGRVPSRQRKGAACATPGAYSLAGLAVLCVMQLRRAECPMWKSCALAGIAALCVIVFLMGLVDGVPALLAGIRG